MRVKLKDVTVGQKFEFDGDNYIRIDESGSDGLGKSRIDMIFCYCFTTNTVEDFCLTNSCGDWSVSVEYLPEPFKRGYEDFYNYNGETMNPYEPDFEQDNWISWEKGFEKAFKDSADACYDKIVNS